MTPTLGLYTDRTGVEHDLFEENGQWVVRAVDPSLPVVDRRFFVHEAAARRAFADVILDDLRPAVAS